MSLVAYERQRSHMYGLREFTSLIPNHLAHGQNNMQP